MIGTYKRKLAGGSWLAVIVLLAFLLPEFETAAQEPGTPAPSLNIVQVDQAQQLSLTLSVDVLSESNVPISGLALGNFSLTGANAADFQITDVTEFTNAEIPLSTILVVDTSETMSGSAIDWAQNAMSQYIATMGAADSAAIISFSTEPLLLQDFTSDKAVLTEIVELLDTEGVGTALNEVTAFSIDHMTNAPEDTRRAIILISDGVDFADGDTTVAETLALAAGSQVPIFTVGIGASIENRSLENLAERTGTIYFEPGTEESTVEVYRQILQDMKQQYQVSLLMPAPQNDTTYNVGLEVNATGTTISNLQTITVSIPVLLSEVASIAVETPSGAAFTPTPGADDQTTQTTQTPIPLSATPTPSPEATETENTVRVTVVSTIQSLNSERDRALATINAIGVTAQVTLSEEQAGQTQTSIVQQQTMTFTPSASETPNQSVLISGDNSPTPIETLRVLENAEAAPHRPEEDAVRDRVILFLVFSGILIFLAASFVHHRRTNIRSKYGK